jgi:DNA-binding CsgD family transcriptional regulator/tetratricopeptide (TPR) repeat protein
VAAALAEAPDGEPPLRVTSGSGRYQAHAAFVRAFAAVAEERPFLLAIGDLHWADESTLELLAYLSHRLPRRSLLVGTYRPEEIEQRAALRRAIADLARERMWELALRRLTASEVGRALRLILGQAARISAETREILQAACAGNPLFLEEILRSLSQRGELRQVEGTWRLGRIRHVPLPASVHDAVRERLAGVSELARQVSLLAATIGERFEIGILLRAAGADDQVVVPAIREAVSAQLVLEVEDGERDRFAFRHPLIREAILDGVLRVERRELHRRVAEAMELEAPTDEALGALAYHWDEARERERAFACHVRAGEHEARRFAHAEALAHFERGLELAPDDDRVVGELSMRAVAMSGVLARAGAQLAHAVRAAASFERTGDARGLGRALVAMNGAAESMLWPRSERRKLIDRALAALEPLGDSRELANAHTAAAMHALGEAAQRPNTASHRLTSALAHARRAVEIAERSEGDRALAYWGLASAQVARGDRDAAVAAFRSGAAACGDDDVRTPMQINNLVILANLIEQTAGPTEEVRALRRRADTLRDKYGVMQTFMAKMHHLFLAGDWDEYLRVSDDHADDPSESAYVLMHHALHRSFIEVARNGAAAIPPARAAYEKVLRSEDVSDTDAVAVPEVALLVGDHAWALEATERAAGFVAHPQPFGPFITYAGVYAILAARGARDEAAAIRWLHRFPTDAPGAAISFNFTVVEHTIRYGALERFWTDGRRDDAIDALATLVDERRDRGDDFGRMTLPGLGIWPLLTYFLALREVDMRAERRGRDDLDQAAARLRWVVAFYGRCGATWYLQRLRERAETLAIPFPRDDLERPSTTPLTGREHEVALLVAKGMTNREIADRLTLSVRTAESHVERIRSKLGFKTRAQVASWATERYGSSS